MQISIWEKESFFAEKDILVIGAGLAGLWTAYELLLLKPNLKIGLLEKGIIPAGASTRNAGFACFGSPSELLHDAALNGEDNMWQVVQMRYKGIQKIKALFGENVIDYDACGGYECITGDVQPVINGLSWLNKGMKQITGQEQVFVNATPKLKTFGFKGFEGMMENVLEAGVHSGKLVQALTKKVQSLGAEILTGIAVTNIDAHNSYVNVFTQQDIVFKAAQVIVCTNAFTATLLPELAIQPARGQVLVTAPVPGLPVKGTFHFDEGFYYFRNLGNRLLLGGARNQAFDEEATTVFDTTDVIQQTLETFIATHLLPGKPVEIEYRWSGIMGFTQNRQPLITNINSRTTAAAICNGMGVAISPSMAEILAKQVLQQ